MTPASDKTNEPPRLRPLVLSLKPRFATAILDGVKTVELRRQRISAPPGTRLVLYASAPVMAVVGVVTLIGNETDTIARIWRRHGRRMALSRTEYDNYLSGSSIATALIIDDPAPLSAPPTLTFLRAETGFRPPQSYRYLHADDPEILHRAAAVIPN